MTGGGQPCGEMDVLEKLTILTDAAKYDAACTSSGGNRRAKAGYIGNTTSSIAGCCHSFSADGRCVTLLKVLMTNRCVYDCKYCVNRRSNEAKRAMFTPEELADLTIQFYRRNYIEGLFLSSGVYRSPDYTTELMIRALRILREEYRFNGYIHAKAIPGTAPELVEQMGFLADRLSVNIELPSEQSLNLLCPDKSKGAILAPMAQIRDGARQSKQELKLYRHAPRFAPAGQSTQMIVGATQDTDLHILRLTQGLYDRYHLRRVFFSAYVPVVEKQILWSKRCKDKSLVGTVKETIMQVSHSKKWASRPVLDASGTPMRTKGGKIILRKSYSVLQDRFHDHMFAAGFTVTVLSAFSVSSLSGNMELYSFLYCALK